jgi:hypothetical protein
MPARELELSGYTDRLATSASVAAKVTPVVAHPSTFTNRPFG